MQIVDTAYAYLQKKKLRWLYGLKPLPIPSRKEIRDLINLNGIGNSNKWKWYKWKFIYIIYKRVTNHTELQINVDITKIMTAYGNNLEHWFGVSNQRGPNYLLKVNI